MYHVKWAWSAWTSPWRDLLLVQPRTHPSAFSMVRLNNPVIHRSEQSRVWFYIGQAEDGSIGCKNSNDYPTATSQWLFNARAYASKLSHGSPSAALFLSFEAS